MTPRVSSEDTRSCQLALPQVRSSWIAWLRLCLPDFFLYCKDKQKHSDNSLLVPWQKSLPKSIRFECSDLRACMHAQSLSPVLLCDPMDCSPPGSPVYGILQARILEWVAMPSSRGSSQPRGQTRISDLQYKSIPNYTNLDFAFIPMFFYLLNCNIFRKFTFLGEQLD